jgi:hypothetical protein
VDDNDTLTIMTTLAYMLTMHGTRTMLGKSDSWRSAPFDDGGRDANSIHEVAWRILSLALSTTMIMTLAVMLMDAENHPR